MEYKDNTVGVLYACGNRCDQRPIERGIYAKKPINLAHIIDKREIEIDWSRISAT